MDTSGSLVAPNANLDVHLRKHNNAVICLSTLRSLRFRVSVRLRTRSANDHCQSYGWDITRLLRDAYPSAINRSARLLRPSITMYFLLTQTVVSLGLLFGKASLAQDTAGSVASALGFFPASQRFYSSGFVSPTPPTIQSEFRANYMQVGASFLSFEAS